MARDDEGTVQRVMFAAFFTLAIVVVLLETAYLPRFGDPLEMVYVDMARHLAAGEGLATSVLAPYYEPKLPFPISYWPPLYFAVVAGVSKLGVEAPVAARTVSIVAFGLSVGLVWLLGARLFGRTVGALSALVLAIWPAVTRMAAMAIAENLFVLFVLLSVVVSMQLIRTRQAPTREYLSAVAGGLAMGGAALTRYSGLALIPIGAASLLLTLRGRAWRSRVTFVAVWSAAASAAPAFVLLRNLLVTGTFIGGGRLPEHRGVLYHGLFAAKVIVSDGLTVLWRMAILPEARGIDSRVMVLGVVGIVALVLLLALRGGRFREHLVGALRSPVSSSEGRFVVAVGVGYWAAMVAARSTFAFSVLDTRMLVPGYPLALVGVVAILVGLAEGMSPAARKILASAIVLLCVGSIAFVVLPRSLSAGGPKLGPGPEPTWVRWVAEHTPPETPIVGNRGTDYNFYLQRPVLSFSGNIDYRTISGYADYLNPRPRFERDCPLVVKHLMTLGWQHAVLVIHQEDGRFDPEYLGRRYGVTIERLLKGEQSLPVRQIARYTDFAAFEILDVAWKCDGG